jgi:hypothetical protein
MKWITREKVKVDRVACPWLIRKFIDPHAEFLFVPADQVIDVAKREGATPYDVKGVEFGHHGKECSFDALVKKHGLTHDPAIVLLAKIVNGADSDNSLWNQSEAAGLNAMAEGFRHLGLKNDHEIIAAESSSMMRSMGTSERYAGSLTGHSVDQVPNGYAARFWNRSSVKGACVAAATPSAAR